MDLMCEGAALNHIGGSYSEKKSWESNAAKIRSLLSLTHLPDDIEIAFEYKCPLSGRIDCMLFGYGKDNKKHIVHIELKQWSNDTVTQIYNTGVFEVSALVGGSYRLLAHPSQQALNYQQNILNYVSVTNDSDSDLNGYAYCYNYKYEGRPNDLYAEQYIPVMKKCPLNAGDQVSTFAETLDALLSGGKGNEVFREFISCSPRPTKNLISAAANIFKGQDDFVLLDDQLTSSNIIFGMIEKTIADPSKKMALIVKGGPGTGKTVIALKVIAELAKNYPKLNALYTTRSKALRNTLRSKLRNIATESCSSADGMIRDIYDFKPAHFSEGEVDVLLIDEAHRIRRSSNFMTDRGMEQTYLTQVISLLYCAKVCVFFIDDHQGINKEEIGRSSSIEDAARHYAERIRAETQEFEQVLHTKGEKAEKTEKAIALLIEQQGAMSSTEYIKKMDRLQKQLAGYKKELGKDYQLKDVKSTVQNIEVRSIELFSQFRCNGSDNYLDWLDTVLYSDRKTAFSAGIEFQKEYHFEVCDSPWDLEKKIRAFNMPHHAPKQIARIAAGYCWNWSDKLQPNGDLYKDVVIGDWKMPWETNNVQARPPYNQQYAPSADLWASHPMGINQVGCIFSAQGFEVDYIGVIMGPDIRYDKNSERIVAEKGHTHSVNDSDSDFDEHIKNIYRVLLSRGRKGCLIYCMDKHLEIYLKELLQQEQHRGRLSTAKTVLSHGELLTDSEVYGLHEDKVVQFPYSTEQTLEKAAEKPESYKD